MQRLLVYLGIMLLVAVKSYAASISSISGTVSNNQTLTIYGSELGTKSPVAPWLYDDFEAGTLDAGLDDESPEVGTAIYERYNSEGNEATYDDTRAFNGTQSAHTNNNTAGSTTRDHFAFRGQAAQARYISYRRYQTSTAGVDIGVYKGDRQAANLGNGNNNPLYDSPPNFGRDANIFTNNCDSAVTHGYLSGESLNAWQRIEQWMVISDVDTANGIYNYYIDFTLDKSSGAIITCSSSCTNGCQIDSWISPNYVNLTATAEFWVDCLYVDKTMQRVEIGDDATWASCTERVIQVPHTTWSSSQIQITVKTGGQTGTKYLFIIDSDGDPLDLNGGSTGEGYEITMGDTYGGSETPTLNGIVWQ